VDAAGTLRRTALRGRTLHFNLVASCRSRDRHPLGAPIAGLRGGGGRVGALGDGPSSGGPARGAGAYRQGLQGSTRKPAREAGHRGAVRSWETPSRPQECVSSWLPAGRTVGSPAGLSSLSADRRAPGPPATLPSHDAPWWTALRSVRVSVWTHPRRQAPLAAPRADLVSSCPQARAAFRQASAPGRGFAFAGQTPWGREPLRRHPLGAGGVHPRHFSSRVAKRGPSRPAAAGRGRDGPIPSGARRARRRVRQVKGATQ
jgi:hypothetical protein